jgi:hypothetical protein
MPSTPIAWVQKLKEIDKLRWQEYGDEWAKIRKRNAKKDIKKDIKKDNVEVYH